MDSNGSLPTTPEPATTTATSAPVDTSGPAEPDVDACHVGFAPRYAYTVVVVVVASAAYVCVASPATPRSVCPATPSSIANAGALPGCGRLAPAP
jgi:hypothetical protein